MAHGCRLRRGRASMPGQIYNITTVTEKRCPLFADFKNARVVVKALKDQQDAGFFSSLCFVVMPDHLHCLMQLGEVASLSAVVQRFKSQVSRQLGGSVWQRGFHDRAVRQEEDLVVIARYIVANPLRAGLVSSIRQYPHWDSVWLDP
jgi:putative transposase